MLSDFTTLRLGGPAGRLVEATTDDALIDVVRDADARGEPLLLIEGNPKYYERFGFTRADAVGIEPPPQALGPQYFMIRPLATYDPAFQGRAVYPPETFGIAY